MRCVLLLCVLVFAVACLAAEGAKTGGWFHENAAQTTSATSARPVTIQGCLSGGNDSFVLSDSNGNSYRLTGDPAQLSTHVGREVAVTGTASAPATSNNNGETSSAAARSRGYSQTIEVTTVKRISKACRTNIPH